MSEITAAFGRAERLIFDTMDENRKLRALNADLLAALKMLLPLAEESEGLLFNASHPDHAKLEIARAIIAKAEGSEP